MYQVEHSKEEHSKEEQNVKGRRTMLSWKKLRHSFITSMGKSA